MDEIIIEEKKYVSSKRAAKMTGYAKDYVGQLCREGRVPARLVGRSWYVLESAIQDHRFGTQDTAVEKSTKEEPPTSDEASSWESPRYEAVESDTLPVLNRLESRQDGVDTVISQDIHDSWREWFDQITPVSPDVEVPHVEAASPIDKFPLVEEAQQEEPEEYQEQEVVVPVPLHVMEQPLPKEFLPRGTSRSPQEWREVSLQEVSRSAKSSTGFMKTTQVVGVLIAAVAVGVAMLGTGYFDGYLASHGQQMDVITGTVLYTK